MYQIENHPEMAELEVSSKYFSEGINVLPLGREGFFEQETNGMNHNVRERSANYVLCPAFVNEVLLAHT